MIGWPHQVAIPNMVMSQRFHEIQAFCKALSRCPRRHTFYTDQSYDVVCFAMAAHAEVFAAAFGGLLMTPETRPRR
jgi:hypothetical protein